MKSGRSQCLKWHMLTCTPHPSTFIMWNRIPFWSLKPLTPPPPYINTGQKENASQKHSSLYVNSRIPLEPLGRWQYCRGNATIVQVVWSTCFISTVKYNRGTFPGYSERLELVGLSAAFWKALWQRLLSRYIRRWALQFQFNVFFHLPRTGGRQVSHPWGQMGFPDNWKAC